MDAICNDKVPKLDYRLENKKQQNNAGGGTTSSSRVGYIDALKGFAILCVVLGHVADGYISAGMYSEHFSLNAIHDAIYSFHMALFMLISGYVFYMAYFDEQGFEKTNRLHLQLLNFIITYIVFDIAFVLFKTLFSQFVYNDTSLISVLLFPIQPIAQYWYLYILISFYIIFSRKSVHQHWKICLAITALCSLLSSFVNILYFELGRFLYYGFFFWLGVCHRKGVVHFFRNGFFTIVASVIALALQAISWIGYISMNFPGIKMVIAAGLSIGLWYLFEHVAFIGKSRFLRFCGRYSLEIYLLHNVFIAGMRAVFRIFIPDRYVLSVTLNFVLSTALPIIISLICKKLSIHELIFKPATYLKKRKNALNLRK